MLRYRLLKLDIHVHTSNSGDSCIELESIPRILKDKGLDGVALTEHDKLVKYHLGGAIILPGAEISTKDGHLLALGISKDIESKMSMNETIEEVHAQGGVAVIAHPYSFPNHVNFKNLRVRPDAIEVLNARTIFCSVSTFFAKKMAERLSVPMAGGSDSHIPDMIGDAFTIVEAKSISIEHILEAFRAGRVRPSGNCSSLRKKLKSRAHSIAKRLSRAQSSNFGSYFSF